MKKSSNVIMSLIINLALVLPVFAESGAREDNSMVLVYLFLATCGLIIFLQLIPVFTMVFGMIKGALGKKEEEAKPVTVKYR